MICPDNKPSVTDKMCSKCRVRKSVDSFHACKSTSDGLQYQCKDCTRQRHACRHAERPDLRAANYRKWLERNAEKKRASRAEYNKKNALKIAAYGVEYKKRNRIKYNESMRMQRKRNPKLRLANNLHCRLWQALKRSKIEKCSSATDLVGCPLEFLKAYLISQFQPGMTWDNRGKDGWHIDHIKPCASFDLSDPEQQRECFHWTNLQVLWALDNHKKGSKFTGEANTQHQTAHPRVCSPAAGFATSSPSTR